MIKMDRKLKGIPVYVMALILVSGTVLGAGVWFLTVDVPVEYDEPVEVYMWNERDDTETQYGGTGADFRLRDRHEHVEELDMTYETFHQHVRLENPADGKQDLEVTVSLSVEPDNGDADDIGIVVFEGEVDPVEVSWEYDDHEDMEDWRASPEGQDSQVVERGSATIPFENLDHDGGGADETFTVIYTNREDTEQGDPVDVSNYNIEWFFEEEVED